MEFPKIFWACGHMVVEDVASKRANKEVVDSSRFSCRQDPRPVEFMLRIDFAASKVGVVPVNRDVSFTGMKMFIFDEKGKSLKEFKEERIVSTKKGTCRLRWTIYWKCSKRALKSCPICEVDPMV